jgi:phosphatidyl-myo-inositol dimannoside synthase
LKRANVLFYYLSAFSQSGGIEKFNRCFIKALSEITGTSFVSVVSVYDDVADEKYIGSLSYRGFRKAKAKSVLHVIRSIYKHDELILGHINLALTGIICKLLRPSCKLILVAHGIEIWKKQTGIKKICLDKADHVLAVSTYTKNQLVLRNKVSPQKITILPNAIDPYFRVPLTFSKPSVLLQRYGIQVHQPVIFTLARLSSAEQYKGYDKVIAALPEVLKRIPDCIYLLAGKYDEVEKTRISELINLYNVKDNVIITGYLNEDEVTDHYLLADVFVMPSKNEGFGIVFLEALACGIPVIGGNQDGTVDALLNGRQGTLINPDSIEDLAAAIVQNLILNNHNKQELQQSVMKHYSFSRFKERIRNSLFHQYAN